MRRRLGTAGTSPVAPVPALSTPASAPPKLPEVEFAGYAEDCQIFGFLRLDAERLSDALNAHQQVRLVDVLLVALQDGRSIPAQELWVAREELLAVRASGPRGNPGRRSRTRPYPVMLQSGPYQIHGYLHGLRAPIRSGSWRGASQWCRSPRLGSCTRRQDRSTEREWARSWSTTSCSTGCARPATKRSSSRACPWSHTWIHGPRITGYIWSDSSSRGPGAS